jgi:proteasome assembly chaperone (PAC2) family protein
MEDLNIESRPQLTKPVLVASFRGWNDGGQGASMATAFLNRHWQAEQFASIDSEGFFDFQSTRPHVSLVDGTVRKIDWPENVFCHARPQRSDRDAVVLLGTEPSLRWRTFAGLVTGLAKDLGVEMVVTLGALLADVPHTRPAPVTASANDASVIGKLNVQPSRYEGPTGIVGVLHDSCREAGISSVSLWAAVPHYVSLTPSPRAAKALCDRLATLIDVSVDTSELDEASEEYMQQVSEAVASDEETAAYVEELEGRVDEFAAESELPSGDTLAAELTRFLREREEGGGDDVARGD